MKQFLDLTIDGVACRTDGVRVDVHGNVWCSSNAGRSVGYSGVTVWNSAGALLGRIRLPEACANVAFGGPKRNRLFMAASQSLYAVYVPLWCYTNGLFTLTVDSRSVFGRLAPSSGGCSDSGRPSWLLSCNNNTATRGGSLCRSVRSCGPSVS